MERCNKKLWVMLLALLVIFLMTANICHGEEEVVFSDDFENYNIKIWGPQPATAITIQDGKLVDKPQIGQVFIASNKKFQYVTFETRVKFNKLSTDSTIFYYLGFQSVTPWCYNVCWVTIQDTAFFASTTRDGGKVVREHVADLESNRWYNIKIVWAKDRVEFSLDGESVYKIQDMEVIPEIKMPIFLSANTLSATGVAADMEIDWVTIKGEPKK